MAFVENPQELVCREADVETIRAAVRDRVFPNIPIRVDERVPQGSVMVRESPMARVKFVPIDWIPQG